MCFMQKPPDPPPAVTPAPPPPQPEKAPTPQEVADSRKVDNQAKFASPSGPVLRRSNQSSTAAPTGPAGIRM